MLGRTRALSHPPGKSTRASMRACSVGIENRIPEGGRPQRVAAVADLAVTGAAAQLAHDFQRLAPAVRVALRHVAAARVDRKIAAQLDAPALHPVRSFSGWSESEAFQRPQNLRREAVVTVQGIDVGGPDPRFPEDRLFGTGGVAIENIPLLYAEAGLPEHKFVRTARQTLEGAQQDRTLALAFGPGSQCEDHDRGRIHGNGAIQPPQGLADPRRRQVLLERQR